MATQVKTPDLGGDAEVSVIEILVSPGDQVDKDTPVVTLESDKATMEVPAGEAGTVKSIDVKVGDSLSMGDPILTLDGGAAAEASPEEPKVEEPKEKPAAKKAAPKKPAAAEEKAEAEEPKRVLTGTVQTDSDIHAGPGVRRMARELGVNLAEVAGSGPKSRILKEDIDAFVKGKLTGLQTTNAPMAAPQIDFTQFGDVGIEPLSRIKKISGKNLQRNWMMIPHVTQMGECDITHLEEFRKSQKDVLAKRNIRLTPLAFIMKGVVAALREFPHFNASLDASGENLVMKKYYHVGVAVDTPDGLVVPVIRDVDKKGLIDLAEELGEVSERARKKQLKPGEMQGGSISVSSLGSIGGTNFTPIINYPEVAIVGVSKASYKPVYEDGEFVPRLMLPLALSYDHRVVDGADGARFMVHLQNMLSDIRNLLL